MSAISGAQSMDFPFATYWFSQPALATVVAEVAPRYQVKCQATYWTAELIYPFNQNSLSLNTTVLVLGRRGLTLLVKPFLPEAYPALGKS